jgi:hypothetical protein
MVTISRVIRWVMLWGAMATIAGKVELVTEDNQRWSTRLVYAKVNPKISQLIRHFLMRIH